MSLFNQIISYENLYRAYKQSIKGSSKYKTSAIMFSKNETYNILKLQNILEKGKYNFGGYYEFMVYEPKERLIHAPKYIDKIVQLAIYYQIKDIYKKTYIYDSYACIDGKGTHKCVNRLQQFLKRANWEYGENAYIIKIDIKKFFYSIDRKILKELLPKKIKHKNTLKLLYQIIDSADEISEKGLPLGNTLSQVFANIYLNQLDQYCKRTLKVKYYIRYADDIVAVVPNKQTAKEKKQNMLNYLNEKLNLEHNLKKTKIFKLSQGVNTVGFKIKPHYKLLRNDSKKRIKKKLRKMESLIHENKMTKEKAEQILNSWRGHAINGNSWNFIQKLLKKFSFIYLENNTLKVGD